MNYQNFEGMTGVIMGTGPSLTAEQVEYVRQARADDKCRVFGVNNAFQVAEYLDVLMSCNIEWWDHYADDAKFQEFRQAAYRDLWTWDKSTSLQFDVNYIGGKWGDSFSTDPGFIHYGHSSGFQIMNLAYHYGIRDFVLVGYDMRYLPGYDRRNKKPGAGRHFFGEYPKELQHWPNVGQNGEFTGLLKVFKTIDTCGLGIKIVNCSPDSALDFFENAELKDIL